MNRIDRKISKVNKTAKSTITNWVLQQNFDLPKISGKAVSLKILSAQYLENSNVIFLFVSYLSLDLGYLKHFNTQREFREEYTILYLLLFIYRFVCCTVKSTTILKRVFHYKNY